MDLRIFVEPQQGASYGQQLAVAQRAEQLGFDAFFRSDHYLKMGDVSGLPGPTDSWVTLGAIARETTHHPARHPGHLGDVPSPGPARDRRGAGRRDVGRSGRAGHRRGLVRRRAPAPTASRSRRSASGSTGSTSSSRSLTGLWSHARSARPSPTTGPTWPVTDSPALPKPVQARRPADHHRRVRPTSHAVARRPVRGGVQRAVLRRRHHRGRCRPTSTRPARRIGRDPATVMRSAAQVVCCGRDERRDRPACRGDRSRARRAGGERSGRHARAAGRQARAVRRGRHHPGVPAGARHRRPGPPGPAGRRGPAGGARCLRRRVRRRRCAAVRCGHDRADRRRRGPHPRRPRPSARTGPGGSTRSRCGC